MLNPRHPDGFQAPESGMTAPQEEDKEGGRKRRLEHNSSDSLAESPKRSLTDEEGSTGNGQFINISSYKSKQGLSCSGRVLDNCQ